MPSLLPENPSTQATKIFNVIRILCIFQLAFGIFTLFVDLSTGFFMLIGSLLLFMIICGRNWCTCVCYVLICMFEVIGAIFGLGEYFSLYKLIYPETIVFVAILMFKIPFFAVTMFYAFLAYRELKALTLEIGMGGSAQPWEYRPEQNFQPFGGSGYSIR